MSNSSCACRQNQTYFCCFSQEENHIYLHLVTQPDIKCSSASACKSVENEQLMKQINLDTNCTNNRRVTPLGRQCNIKKVKSNQKMNFDTRKPSKRQNFCNHSKLSCCDICCSGIPDGKAFCCEHCTKAAETERKLMEKKKNSKPDQCRTCQQMKPKPKPEKSRSDKNKCACNSKSKPGYKKKRYLFSWCNKKSDNKRCKECDSGYYVKRNSSSLSIQTQNSECFQYEYNKKSHKNDKAQPRKMKKQHEIICTSSTTCHKKVTEQLSWRKS